MKRSDPRPAPAPAPDAARAYHHGDLKAALLSAGLELLEEQGLAALSLRAISARVGVSHAAPRNHFGSLRGLLTALATEGFRRHAAFMREGLTDVADREARYEAAMTGYVRFAQTHPALFSLMFSAELCNFTDADFRQAGAESYAVLAEVARDLAWDRADDPDAQRKAEIMLWSLVHGYAELAIAGLLSADAQTTCPSFTMAEVMPVFGYRGSDTRPL